MSTPGHFDFQDANASKARHVRLAGVILAGGESRRMGRDKGLAELHGKPLAAHVADRLRPQVDDLLLIANRNAAAYRRIVKHVYPDVLGGFRGPLAGMHAALSNTQADLLLCVPCDLPLLPRDLAPRLLRALIDADAEVAAAHDGERLHPVVCLLRRSCLSSLEQALAEGRHKVGDWLAAQRHVCVDFSDQPEAFRNCNSPAELQALASDKH